MKKLTILGAGESGVGAAILGKKEGYETFLSDGGMIKPNYQQAIQENFITYEQGNHSLEKILESDLVVKSPGIPKNAPILSHIQNAGIPIISEIEFASRHTQAKIIAITGSNGKTTTTSLVYHILSNAGLNVGVAGNIGDSFAKKVAENQHDYYVLEVSSFQLDDIQTFKPYIAVLLNITPDHLDQYGGKLAAYAKSKFRITHNQNKEDYFVYNFDDEYIVELLKDINTQAHKVPFSTKENQPQGAFCNGNEFLINYPTPWSMHANELALSGMHNVSNSLAAAITANILEISKDTIKECLSNFEAVEHRLEKVSQKGGVHFINDSKATNINATFYALQSMTTPTIWIVGGQDKGNDYSELYELVDNKVKAIVCLGVDNSKIIHAFKNRVDYIVDTHSMESAIKEAVLIAEKGNTILLSPACASFDLFNNYEHRGKEFKKEIEKL